MAGERVAEGLAGVGVPQPHRAVVAGAGQPVPVGAERHTPHRAGVAGERGADGLAGVGVPQPHRAVVAGAGQPVPVGAERHTAHRAGVAGERGADGLAGVGVPQPHRAVVAGAGQPVPVGAERHTGHRAGVAGDDLEGAGPLDHRVVEHTVVGGGEGAGGQDLLEGARVPAGLGAGQHALGLGVQLLRGRGPQIGLGSIPFGAGLDKSHSGGRGNDGKDHDDGDHLHYSTPPAGSIGAHAGFEECPAGVVEVDAGDQPALAGPPPG